MSDILKEATGPAATLRYKGVFDYDKLYKFCIDWFKSHNYEYNIKTHKHKMSCPHGFKIELTFDAWKKLTEYYLYRIGMEWTLWDAFQVDVIRNGKKIKLWNARLEIRTFFTVECDYTGRWEKSQWTEKLRNFFNRRIIKKEIVIKHADTLYYIVLGLHTELKKMLEMEASTAPT